tara:strand:- start:167 stop:760 length:594 start_codon:yes stop_codon:yes gene_type:complete
MKSSKFTLNDIGKKEKEWKDVILKNELILFKRFLDEGLDLAYKESERNAWIIKTLVDKKQRYKFKKCKTLILVGSGIYPYSMFDVHKQYPHIKQIGLEIDINRAIISKQLVKASPAKDTIKIITIDGIDFDYSWMTDEDFVFLSVDVNSKQIYKKVVETSKAQPLVCAPYKYSWLKNLVSTSSISSSSSLSVFSTKT